MSSAQQEKAATINDKSNVSIHMQESSSTSYVFDFDPGHETTPSKPLLNSPFVQNFVDSFKRAEPGKTGFEDLEYSSSQKSESLGKTTELKKRIKPRHVFLIQLGSGLGTGLLVGNGSALREAGPAGLLIGYIIVSSFIYCTYNAIAELGISYSQLSGSYNEFSSILIDRAFGFSVACVYALQWLTIMPLELTTSSMIIKYWTTKVNPDVFVVIFYVILVIVNFMGGAGFAEFEFFMNSAKVCMLFGFVIFGIISDCGGSYGNGYTYIGGRNWKEPIGAFFGESKADHFKGICSSFVYAAFAYGGFETSILSAAEQVNPRKSIMKAGKMLLFRIIVMYCLFVLIIGLLVPHNSSRLLGNGSSASSASPLVIATSNITALPHIINAVILMSVLSVANASLFISSRVVLSICEQFFPRVPLLTYVDRRGRPLFGLILAAIIGLLSFVAASPSESIVFTWLLSISGLSALFTYLSMNLSHIRFRKAMKVQGKSLNEMGYLSKTGIWGSYYSSIIIALIFIAQFWIALVPVGTYKPDANNFFQNYLAMVVFVVLYFGFKIITKEWHIFIPSDQVDLSRGRKIFDHELLKQEEQEEAEKSKKKPLSMRIKNFWS
ncbi:General amino acid permease AGP1 [Hanseniaspora osmophila]|uniref:General amino acid permease AGP1 n=1 Tax=Hanseniaspora osmophila TaxID=56408 RepID=A0A1E5RHK8_9ASCO|nr:General amino acid permease AGP1 [Hanseniaspora osmophila]